MDNGHEVQGKWSRIYTRAAMQDDIETNDMMRKHSHLPVFNHLS
jgi:hypothetical protein